MRRTALPLLLVLLAGCTGEHAVSRSLSPPSGSISNFPVTGPGAIQPTVSRVGVTRIKHPVRIKSGEVLYPVASGHVAGVSVAQAFRSVPRSLGRSIAVYLGSLRSSRFLAKPGPRPVYVFKFDSTCLPSNGMAGDLCGNGAIIDVVVTADTGREVVLSQVTKG